jgi:hypothetical protein
MADPLDSLGLDLPYDYSKGEAPGAPAAAPVKTQAPTPTPAPAPNTSHPELDNIPVPYDATKGESPGAPTGPPAPPKTWGDTASDFWHNTILGQNQSPIVLQPRSLSQAGTDVSNFGRDFGNQAFVPGALDVGLAALHGTDIATENAKTKQADADLGPVAGGAARFMGQRASLNRFLGEAGVPYANSPIAQGLVTGGGGTLLHGGNWTDVLFNTAADTGLSALGEAGGTAASAAAKKVFDQSRQAVSNTASAGLEHLQDLWKKGGEGAAKTVTETAEQYANAATGAAKDAYQQIADAARKSTETGWAQRLAAGGIGHFLPGGELATAYIADPAIRAYNQFSKGLDVTHAIHDAYSPVAGVVKTAIDPDAWRSALQNFAVSQGPAGSGTVNAVSKFSPTSWGKYILPSSQ